MLHLLYFQEDLYLKIVEEQEQLNVWISVLRSIGHKSEVYSSATHE